MGSLAGILQEFFFLGGGVELRTQVHVHINTNDPTDHKKTTTSRVLVG